jgi:FtsH-binding integral membrane protein
MRVVVLVLLLVLAAGATDQRLSFDSKGEVMTLSPELNRKAGVFPDLPGFDRAELWLVDSAYHIETYFPGGVRERRRLTEPELDETRRRVDAFLQLAPGPTRPDQTGRGSFLIQQIPLALGWYGPAMSALILPDNSDPRWIIGILLLGSSACYFGPLMMTSNAQMTDAQAHLSVAYGYRGILTGSLISLAFEFGSHRPYVTTMLATSIGGQVLGYKLARDLSTGQANLVSAWTDHGTLDGFLVGTCVTDLFFKDDHQQQSFAIPILLGQAVGGVVGVTRTRAWDCTEGQVYVHRTAGLIGAAVPAALYFAAFGFPPDNNYGIWQAAALGIAGNVAGIWWIENELREMPLSTGNGLIVAGTAIGGVLLGAGLGYVAFPEEPRVFVATGAAGGVTGLLGGLRLAKGLQASNADSGHSASRVRVNFAALASAAVDFASTGSFSAPTLITIGF